MELPQVATIISIVVITYLIGLAIKCLKQINNKIIPVVVGVCGGILGAVALYVIPGFPANNIMDAIAIGIVNGLASTGVNQIYKQFKKE